MPDLHTEFSRLLPADEIAELSPTLLKDQRNRFTSAPDIILQPRSVESVQTIMRFCYEHRIPVTPQG
ncbi:TPA: FAD-binding oxidoreductase, partial [Neisseria meningitidis]